MEELYNNTPTSTPHHPCYPGYLNETLALSWPVPKSPRLDWYCGPLSSALGAAAMGLVPGTADSPSTGLAVTHALPIRRGAEHAGQYPSYRRRTTTAKQIVVPLDGTMLAHMALPHSAALARATSGRLALLHVMPLLADLLVWGHYEQPLCASIIGGGYP